MRKNILRTFIAAVATASFLVVPAYAESAVVAGNGVNFRAGPGMNYYVIATLDKGTPVTVTDRSNGAWYAVSCGGYDGFISASYLSITESGASAAPVYTPAPAASASAEGYINAMYVRFRSGPGSAYSVLGEYNKGKAVTLIGSGDGWTACVIDGQLGYVYSQYISTDESHEQRNKQRRRDAGAHGGAGRRHLCGSDALPHVHPAAAERERHHVYRA